MLNCDSKSFLAYTLVISNQVQIIHLSPLENTSVESTFMAKPEFEVALVILISVLLLLGVFLFTVVCSFVCYILQDYSLCQNDSWCQFFNRDFKVESKKSEIFTINIEESNRKNSADSLKAPLFESEKAIDFYGTKSEDSDETINYCNSVGDDFYFNRQGSNMYSFRKNEMTVKQTLEPENLDPYTSYFIISPLPDSKNDLLESHLNDLENIEQHLSKSLSELSELHKKLCPENQEISEDAKKLEESNE